MNLYIGKCKKNNRFWLVKCHSRSIVKIGEMSQRGGWNHVREIGLAKSIKNPFVLPIGNDADEAEVIAAILDEEQLVHV